MSTDKLPGPAAPRPRLRRRGGFAWNLVVIIVPENGFLGTTAYESYHDE
ncbi:MAG: hypothetical protein ABR611_02985 [Chthoniobacterales bacterium]